MAKRLDRFVVNGALAPPNTRVLVVDRHRDQSDAAQ